MASADGAAASTAPRRLYLPAARRRWEYRRLLCVVTVEQREEELALARDVDLCTARVDELVGADVEGRDLLDERNVREMRENEIIKC